MILALLSLLPIGAPQVPSSADVPAAIAARSLTASVQVTTTHFLATSYRDDAQWIVFSNEERGLRRVCALAARGRTLLPIVAGAAEGMSFELLARVDGGRLVTSGSMACEEVHGSPVFLALDVEALVGWSPRHGGRALERTPAHGSSLPEGFTAVAAAQSRSLHVPVPTPAENRKRNKTRRLDRKKLPPV